MNKKQPESKKQSDADFSWVDDYEERPVSKQPPVQSMGEEVDAEELFAVPSERKKIDLALEDTQEIQEDAPLKERKTLQGKQTRRRTRRSYKRTVLAILAALCVVLMVGLLFSDTFSEMLRHNTAYTLWETEDQWELSDQNTRMSAVLGDLVLSGDGDGLSAYSAPQTLVWNITYQMTNPVVCMASEYALVMDVGGKSAVVCNQEGLCYQVVTQYPILTGDINENGWITLIGEDVLQHEILVYSNEGNQVLRRMTSGASDGQPMAAILNDEGTCLVTAYTAYDSTTLSGRVTFFDLTVSGGTYTDRISANFVYDDTIITDLYIEGNTCIAAGDGRIIGFGLDGTPAEVWNKQLTNQIAAMDFGDGFLGIIFGEALSHEAESFENHLVLYGMDGSELYHTTLENPSFLQAVGDHIIYGEGRSYVCIDTKGRSEWFYNALEDVQAFYPLSDGRRVIRRGGSTLYVMNIVGAEEGKAANS